MHPADRIRQALQVGDLAGARAAALAGLARTDADPAALHALIGKLALALDDPQGARDHLEAAVERGIDDPAAWMALAQLSGTRADRRAQLLARAARHPRGGGRPALLLANDFLAAGRGDDALAWLAEATDDPATAAEAWAQLVDTAADLGRLDVADEALQGLLDLQPAAPAPLVLAAVQRLAPELGASDAMEGALSTLEQAGADPAALAGLRAVRWVALRQPEAARQAANQAVQLRPQVDAFQQLLGEALLLCGQTERAVTVLEPLANRGALAPSTLLAWADALTRRGQADRALPLLESVLARAPEHAGAWLEMARVCAELGHDDRAEAAMQRAMALDGRVDAQAGKATTAVRQILEQVPEVLAQVATGSDWQVARLRMGHNALLVQLQQAGASDLYAKCYLPGRRSAEHVEQTADLEERLARQADLGLAVPQPLRDGQGQAAQPCGGGFAVVQHAIAGQPLRQTVKEPLLQLEPGQAEAMGAALAKLHQGLQRVGGWQRAPQGLSSAVAPLLRLHENPSHWLALRAQLGLFDQGEALGDQLQALLEPWLGTLAQTLRNRPHGIVHGDFGWHNLQWQGEGRQARVVGALDFDYAAWDFPESDLAQAICRTSANWKRLTTHQDPAARPELARALRQGYRQAGGNDPGDQGLAALLLGSRAAYGMSLALAGLQDAPAAPQLYGPALDAVQVLLLQLQWLDRHVGDLIGP
ncbi:MAG: tetratricopeptide repeat protein [Deltaproteobacteria bacterium]|nr:tetratricopeptide repeat protein [Deltaproteobacteria bacterium]